jgi:hypothetical protein
VETTIKWEGGMKTRGVHSDQLAAAIQATEHALNMIALRSAPTHTKGQGVRGKGQRAVAPHPSPFTPISKQRSHGPTRHKKIVNARRG